MLYATAEDVAAGFRNLSDDEKGCCVSLLEEAAVIIDAYNAGADADRKKLVSCRMVRRILGDGGGNDARLHARFGERHGLLPELDDGQRQRRRAVSLKARKEAARRRGSHRRPQPFGGIMR